MYLQHAFNQSSFVHSALSQCGQVLSETITKFCYNQIEEAVMHWSEIRATYPEQWLIVEALEAHTTEDSQRLFDRLAVIETCVDGNTAMQRYRELHQEHPQREYYFVHTSREELTIHERQWLGIRRSNAVISKG
ncbi:MAG: hypothetical protein U9R58_06630 [Chloroflexota bacterium]|nr:hypothetical protein [Chloroflexota bacterium]